MLLCCIYSLLINLDDLASVVSVADGEEFVSISSEVALSIAVRSTAGMHPILANKVLFNMLFLLNQV